MRTKPFVIALLLASALAGCRSEAEQSPLPRTIVTTDGEVDDYDSFIRLLLYSNEMDLRALVYSSSKFHWAGDGKGTLLLPVNRQEGAGGDEALQVEAVPRESYRWIGTDWMQDLIGKYEEVYPNLVRHDPGFPAPDYLRSIVKIGNIMVEGDMSEPTEGSEFIKDIILEDDPSPLYVQIWGGTNTFARALLSIEEEYGGSAGWPELYRKISDKLVLNIILDQDGTYLGYVAKNWPDVRVVYNERQFFSFAYLWNRTVPEVQKPYLRGSWFEENILDGHGPLAASYLGLGSGYDIGDEEDRHWDPELAERMGGEINDFISEGDSPSYFLLHDWGLRSVGHPDWGGLGGRFYQDPDNPRLWRDPAPHGKSTPGGCSAEEPAVRFDRTVGDFNPETGTADMWYPQTRWVKILQNDFASRADWCVGGFEDANHRPSASISGGPDIVARPGQRVVVEASVSDPDGNGTSCSWWQYREAGTSDCVLALAQDGVQVEFTVPEDAVPGTTLHIILEVTDDGTPELTGFQRVIVTVE